MPPRTSPRSSGATHKVALGVLIALSLVLLADFLRWIAGRDFSGPGGALGFAYLALVLGITLFHVVMAWYLALRFEVCSAGVAPGGKSVDVFVTAMNEDPALVERTVRAARDITYPHATYLLDDSADGRFRALAERLDLGYFNREGNADFKAGNVNAALRQTDGEIVAIFDVDHAPRPELLDRTLGAFDDSRVGFVQTMITFSNRDANVFASASAQTSFDYYHIAAVGKDRCGAASLMGTNALLRREALESIGFYRPGLAEDLETSLALHAKGWKSRYVREPLAPGLTPADFVAFSKQQLKWSRGVFDAALGSLGGSLGKLDLHQKLCYLTRFTYYLFPLLFALGIAIVTTALVWPVIDVETFAPRMAPFIGSVFLTRLYTIGAWARTKPKRSALLFSGPSLVASSWPIYATSFVCRLFRLRQPFLPTPKKARWRLPLWTFLPQIVVLELLAFAIAWRVQLWDVQPMPATTALAALMFASHWMLFVALVRSVRTAFTRRGAVAEQLA